MRVIVNKIEDDADNVIDAHVKGWYHCTGLATLMTDFYIGFMDRHRVIRVEMIENYMRCE